jgi:hypothetical protein
VAASKRQPIERRSNRVSHLSRIELEIKDLDDLKGACHRLGIEFLPNQKTFRWYGEPKECESTIRVPGAAYEIGVVREGNAYALMWDNYGKGGLETRLGRKAGLLKQAYAVERTRREAVRRGYRLQESKTEKGIRLQLTLT